MRPLIGIATSPFRRYYADFDISEMTKDALDYFWRLSRLTEKIILSVERAGGVPALLTATRDGNEIKSAAASFDGFIFAGGEDVTPSFYGEANKGTVGADEERDFFELALSREILKRDLPVLGICRGCQLLNVALGGTLVQHMPDVKAEWASHKRSDVMKGYVHEVDVLRPDLFKGSPSVLKVNSMHHQAIGRLAPGVEAAAATADGVTEAISVRDKKFALAVQWHPECLAEDDDAQAALFESLVKNASL